MPRWACFTAQVDLLASGVLIIGSVGMKQCSASLMLTGLLAQLQHKLASQQVGVCHEAAGS